MTVTQADYELLQAENAALRQRIAELEQAAFQGRPAHQDAHSATAQTAPADHTAPAFLRILFEHLPIPIAVFLPDGLLIEMNQPMLRAAPMHHMPSVGTFNILTDQESCTRGHRNFFLRALQGKTAHMPPVRYHLPARVFGEQQRAQPVWMETSYIPLYDNTETLRYIVAINLDVTERKRAEHHLHQSQTLLQRIIEHSPSAIFVKDREGRFLLANQRMVADLGRPAEQIIGVRDVDLYPPEVLHQWHDNDQHVLAADAPLQFEETFPYDGKLQTYLAAKFPLHDEQGNIYAVGVITTNITERKQMEEALRRSEARLDAFFSSAPVGLALLDDQLRYVKINQTAASFNGHSIEAHLGKTVAEILPDLPPTIMPMLQQVLTSGQPLLNLEFSAEVTSQPSETLYAEISVFPIMGRNEQPVGLGSILIDVTTRKRAEQERQRLLQELARSARLKDEFLANMSHELRTPLNAIMGLSEALREGIYGPLASRQQATLQTVEESGRHLLDMINDILDLAKIEAGKIDLDWSIVSVVSLCQTCLQLIRQSAHKKRIKVFEDFRQGAAILYADERRLKQMLVNLLSNAVKFTPEGGHIGLTVTGDREQGAVHFTVWDTGIGIAAGDMERLFQPFVQIDSSLARQYEGTGLGLSLVARLAEMHGGSVGVESEPGKGSRFMVSLPWDAESEEHIAWNKVPPHLTTTTPLTPSDTSTPADAPLILLVEDNQTTSEMMASYLSAHGYRLRLARHGAEALEATRDERPALVLMDIQLPHMDGLTAIRQFRADAALVDLPIIAMTALAMPGDRERCLQAGANDYLSKPVSLKYVLQLIETQYSSNQS